jgi:hypothetical protein
MAAQQRRALFLLHVLDGLGLLIFNCCVIYWLDVYGLELV